MGPVGGERRKKEHLPSRLQQEIAAKPPLRLKQILILQFPVVEALSVA
jgi:hypothetical protein